jgi:hypothetical protein
MTTALVGAMCTPAAARAQYVDARTSIAVAASYSRAITDQPYPTAFTLSGPSVALTPGVTLLADTPLTSETLVYNLSFSLPFTSSLQIYHEPVSYANHLTFTSRVSVDPLTDLTFSLGFIESPVNASVGGTGDSAEAPVDFIPAGVDYTVSGSAQAGVSRQLSELLSVNDSIGTSFGAPYDPLQILPRVMSARDTLTLSRQFENDTLGLTLNVGYNYTTLGQSQNGTLTFPTQSFSNSLTATWTRTLLETLSVSAGAGVAQTVNLANPGNFMLENQHWSPTASLSLNYHKELAVAALAYSHAQSINLTDGSDNFTDSLSLRFSLPAGNTGITSSATAAVNHNLAVGGVLTTGPETTYTTDFTLLYRPPTLTSTSVSIRGQASRQVAQASTTDLLPAMALAAANLTRLSITLSMTFSYPDASAVRTTPHLGPVVSAGAPEPAELLAPPPVHFQMAPPPSP